MGGHQALAHLDLHVLPIMAGWAIQEHNRDTIAPTLIDPIKQRCGVWWVGRGVYLYTPYQPHTQPDWGW